MAIHTHTENQAVVEGWNLVIEANWIEDYTNCTPEALNQFSTWRGTVATFQTVEITKVIEQEPEFRYGYNGMLVDVCKSTTETVLESTKKVLRQRKGQLVWLNI